MECLERDLEECIAYLRFPAAPHRRIRTTNRLERLNGDGRRRPKVIPRFPTDHSCLPLLFATRMTASKPWRGVLMSAGMRRQLQMMREEITTDATTNDAAA
jgi:transposase-like protein